MKNISLIALFLFGMAFASNANSSVEIAIPVQSTERSVQDNTLNASSIDASSEEADSSAKKKKKRKKAFRDRSIAGKILIIAGTAVFAVLCILYGTVSIG